MPESILICTGSDSKPFASAAWMMSSSTWNEYMLGWRLFSMMRSSAATSGSMMIIGKVIPALRSSTPSSATATAR